MRVYNLAKQQMVKRLISPARMISSMDIHHGGDNILVGSYDRRVCWFDMDLKNTPYKTLKSVHAPAAAAAVTARSCTPAAWRRLNVMRHVCVTSCMRRYHQRAARAVRYHRTYPLFASASDDGKVHVFHGTVYTDLLTNPLIVPVKILDAHTVVKELGVLDCQWHPTQPFVFTAGADKVVRMFT